MEFIIKLLFSYPLAAELVFAVAASAAGACLSVWGGWKLYAALAGRNRTAAAVGSFLWYLALFVYFSSLFFVLPHVALINFGVRQYDLDRLNFAGGNYPLIPFFAFLVGGGAIFFERMKKRVVPETAEISLPRALWLGARKALLAVLLVFVALVISRIPAVQEKELTEETVKKIHSQKITLADVLGNNLPPEPDARLKDATVEGIDTNQNGIRDDVELAIFKLHPDSARIRAAELQYAMALQMEMTQVFNSETLVATLQQATRGFSCVGDTGPKISRSDSQDIISKVLAIANTRRKEVENLIFNNSERKAKGEQIFDYMTSYGDMKGPNCDIDLTLLPK